MRCVQQAELFARAAYYDRNKTTKAISAVKEGGRRSMAMDAQEFDRAMKAEGGPIEYVQQTASTLPNTISLGIQARLKKNLGV